MIKQFLQQLDEIFLIEALSSIVYHDTYYEGLLKLLKDNRFKLTPALGTVSDIIKDKFFYLSTSRLKWGGYSRSREGGFHAVLVLDGDKLNHNYKAIPVDYWGKLYRDHLLDKKDAASINQFLRNNENEDRLISDKMYIDNAAKYIKEIHCYISNPEVMGDKGKSLKKKLQQITFLAKKNDIPIYFYEKEDLSAFKLQNKSKAKTFNELKFPDYSNEPEDDELKHYATVRAQHYATEETRLEKLAKAINELLHANTWKLKPQTNDLIYRAMLSIDGIRPLQSMIHNARSSHYESDHRGLEKLSQIMIKYKTKSLQELRDLVYKKQKELDDLERIDNRTEWLKNHPGQKYPWDR